MKQNRKSEKLYDAITDIRDEFISQTRPTKMRRRKIKRFASIAAVLTVVFIAGIALWPYSKSTTAAARTLAAADYPTMVQYPKEADYLSNDDTEPESGNVYDGTDGEPDTGNISDGAGSVPETDSIFDHEGDIPDDAGNKSVGGDIPDDAGNEPADGDASGSAGGSQDSFDVYMSAYDAWWEDIQARQSLTGYADHLTGFLTDSTKCFLSGISNENRVYSPLNVYMALGMLAELTDGDSRQQILDLLGSETITSLRKQASDLWNANYRDDGLVTSILASSLWLDEGVRFRQPAMDTLAKYYYASSYQGEMGSAKYDKALQNWLNEQTGGLLKKQASDITLNPETVLALATTLYYHAQWNNEFSAAQTKKDTFHAAFGDITCDFLHRKKANKTYYWGQKFSAVSEGLESSGSMWFLLPDEGVTVDDLLNDSEAISFLLPEGQGNWKNQKSLLVNLAIPKFDVSSQFDLQEGLKKLGITDVFAPGKSDFSPMAAQADAVCLSQADHAGRVMIDEKGVTAASFTEIFAATSAMPPDEEIDFVLDRPFLFAVTGSDGLPLFIGIVNQP